MRRCSFPLLAAALVVTALTGVAEASAPKLLSQQGRLLALNDKPIEGTVSIVFALYDTPTGGTPFWKETHRVVLDQGYFAETLGTTQAIDTARLDAGAPLYMGIQVGSDSEMSPREEIVSVPYALAAEVADVAVDVTGPIHPISVSVNGSIVINERGEWVGPSTGLVGPQGPAGARGADGAPGETGASGAPGPRGPEGPAGQDGVDGAAGPIGPMGPDGPTGERGPIGPQGAVGAIGPMGPDGPTGERGAIGPQGLPGVNGTDGAAGPAGADGAIGPEGPEGAQGPQGLQGIPGLDGHDATGERGPIGPMGPLGPVGPQGPQGVPGSNGTNGGIGPQGPQGNVGPAGPTGPQGPQGNVGPQGPSAPTNVGCPAGVGFTTIQFTRSTLCIGGDSTNTTWNAAAGRCYDNFSGASLCSHEQLQRACSRGSHAIVQNRWMSNRIADDWPLYTNGTDCANFDGDNAKADTNSKGAYCCLEWMKY